MEKIHKEILGLMGKIDIDCRNEQDVIIIELTGMLDIYNSGNIEKLVDAYIARDFTKFVIDLEKVTYLDSSTISALIHCFQKLNDLNGKLILSNLSGQPREIFEMAKLLDIFQSFPDSSSAIKSLLN